jgi:hypothetical protein
MSFSVPFNIRQLTPDDVALMEGMLTTFGEAFDEVETYSAARPSKAYLKRLLGSDYFVALAALKNGSVVGGIAAYELHKFERERSEIYIYDLAVAAAHRSCSIVRLLHLSQARCAQLSCRQRKFSFVDAVAGSQSISMGISNCKGLFLFHLRYSAFQTTERPNTGRTIRRCGALRWMGG